MRSWWRSFLGIENHLGRILMPRGGSRAVSRRRSAFPRIHSFIHARNFRACHQFSAHACYGFVTKPDREPNLHIGLLRIRLEPVRRFLAPLLKRHMSPVIIIGRDPSG